MALTKVSGGILDPGINVAGIVTATGFDGPFIGGIGDHIIAGIITATGLDVNGNADISGSLTVGSGGLDLNGNGDVNGNFVIGGDLTVNGTTTTIDTNLIGVTLANTSGSSINVGVGITRASTDDVSLMKNVPIPQGSSFEFMGGNKVVLETTDTFTAESDVNNRLDVALTIMEITQR